MKTCDAAVYVKPSQLQPKASRSPGVACVRTNGTIQFDWVFVFRACGDAAVLISPDESFTCWG